MVSQVPLASCRIYGSCRPRPNGPSTAPSSTPLAELLNIPIPRIGALLPYILLVLILFFRPRGLMGTRDT